MIEKLTKKSLKTIVLFTLFFINASYVHATPLISTNLIALSDEEKVWLTEHPTIKLGVTPAYPPFGSINTSNEYVGFSADIIALIEKKLGIKFEVQKQKTWAETIELAQQSKIDMVAGLVQSPSRSEYLHFTSSYIQNPSVIVNRVNIDGYIGDLKNLYNKKVAVGEGSFMSDALKRDHPEIEQIFVPNIKAALEMVASGKANAYVGNAVSTSYSIRRLGLSSLAFSGNTKYSTNHHLGIVKPNPVLFSIMEKALASIDQSTRDQIANKWFNTWVEPRSKGTIAIAIAAVSSFFLVILATWLYTSKKTRRALRAREQQIVQQANFDTLTGLLNRRHFNQILDEEMDSGSSTQFALLFLDISQFKEINDTLGHNIGDALLKRISRRLKRTVRTSDIIARLGGDEFIIILKRVDEPNIIEKVVRTVRSSLKAEFMIEEHSIHISSSIGVTLYPKDARTRNDLLANLDQAMNASKKRGPDSYTFFNDDMRKALLQRTATLRDLKVARQQGQFELYYQPIIDLKTGQITKAEALIRWKHPKRGLVNPADFIKLAEDSGLIHDIGEWIFETATKQVAQWRTKYSPMLQISINTSPLQYRDNGIDVKHWQTQLEALNLSGNALVLEITESLLMDTVSIAKSKLKRLSNSGMEVAIDDFGTGYSSLSYMKKFDIDYLKIDQSFVTNLTAESDDLALCEAIIVMAHKLDCKVVAEGIETEQHCRLLKEAGCDYGQGYLFSKPVTAADFENILKNPHSTLDPTATKQISLRI